MIIKGSARGSTAADSARLADHLLASENEEVELIELRGVAATDLAGAFEEMRLVSMGGRSRRPLYHSSINLPADEAKSMTPARWQEAVDELERHLSLNGHPRAVVRHRKAGRSHTHVVWSRIDPQTLRTVHDGQSYKRHETCARALEKRWRLKPVIGVHTRPAGTPRPVARMTHECHQAEERTGIPVNAVAIALMACWRDTRGAQDFAAAVQKTGLILARGRRGIVAVDAAGVPHSISRRIKVPAVEVQRRLTAIDIASLPDADDVTINRPKADNRGRAISMKSTQRFEARRGRRKNQPPQVPLPLTPEYWRDQGYQVEQRGPMLIVTLAIGTVIEDSGDLLVLVCNGPPTDEEIKLMVAAAKERGWQGIRFTGSASFQQRARREALRQGFPLAAISLECEDHLPRLSALSEMPDHIRRHLHPDVEVEAVPDSLNRQTDATTGSRP